MSESQSETPDLDRTTESAGMIESPAEGDPADLAGTAASDTAGTMHDEVDEVDEIADEADTTT